MRKYNKLLIFTIFVIFCISAAAGTVSAANTDNNTTVISSNSDVNLTVANVNGTMYNTSNNTTYNFFNYTQAGGGNGLQPLHISSNNNTTMGDVTFTNKTSGTFYLSDTGGQGNWDDGILMVAINGTIPDDFSITITSSGYTFAPVASGTKPSLDSLTYQVVALNETFFKDDFIYGPQTWKPCSNSNYPIYEYQDMSTNNTFYIMFVDLYAGIIGTNTPGYDTLINNGMLQVNYTINDLPSGSLLAFDAYSYKMYSNHNPGVTATNLVNELGGSGASSGYYVNGLGEPPVANFSASDTKGTIPFTVQFTDQSSQATSWLWDFGDGTNSTLENPTHTYNSTGTYTVTLTVTNSEGSDQETMEIITSTDDIQPPKPTSNIPGGLYNSNQTVTLSATDDRDPNPKIYYTLNGDDPTTSSNLYNGSLSITDTTTLKFIAVDASGNISGVFTVDYTIDETAPIPSASLPNGTYNTRQTVTLNATDNLDSNPKIYYTLNGSTPTTKSTLYSGPISIYKVGTNTLKFIAVDAAGNLSPVYSTTYTMVDIKIPVALADLSSGTYKTDQVVDLSATDELDPNPKIYYTLNGTDPTTNSTLYTWPISIGNEGTTILKFIAVDAAGHISNIVMRTYTLDKPAASGTWNSTTLDTGSFYNSIAVDSSGYPHIAYFKNPNLEYAYKDKTGWHIKSIDSSTYGAGFYVSLALDSSNNPHIVYFDLTSNTLKYAYEDGTGWHSSSLISNEDISSIDMVLYQNKPRILFYDNKNGKLEYMYYNDTNWVINDVASVSSGGRWNSLALDSSGTPYISFYNDAASGGLEYAKLTVKGEWHISTVDNSTGAGEWNSIVLNSAGNPCISYIGSDGYLKYFYWNGAQWVTDSVNNLKSTATELVLDQSGNPYIVYKDSTSGNLKYAYKDGSWICSNIDTVSGTGNYISLTLSPSGIPNVSYSDGNSYLKYAYLLPFSVNASTNGGSYNTTKAVTLTSTNGTTVYYTTDGSDPRTSSKKIKYTSSILISRTTTLKFAAVDSANNWSSVHTETYIISDKIPPTANASLASGLYNVTKSVTLKMSEIGSIYYTTNGITPTTSSKKYTGAITISSTTTLKFLAVDAVGNKSPVYIMTYKIDKTAPKVSSTSPKSGATGVSRTSTIAIKFSESVKASVSWSKVYVKNLSTGKVVAISKWISGNTIYIKMTLNRYAYNWYQVYIPSSAVKDSAGNNAAGYTLKFETGKY